MKPPQSFYDFTLQFHQDLDLVYPDWSSDIPGGRDELYEDFRQWYGDHAVQELSQYFKKLLSRDDVHLGSLWFKKSKADWIIPNEGVRWLFSDFIEWAESAR